MLLPRASPAILLATCLLWHVSMAALPNVNAKMGAHGTMHVVVPEGPKGLGTPKDFRGQGGISNDRLPPPEDTELTQEWQRLRNIRIEESDDIIDWDDINDLMVDVEFYPDQRLRNRVQGFFDVPPPERRPSRVWIYEIATAPNVMTHPLGNDANNPSNMLVDAIGGIIWSQVVRYTQVDPSHPAMTEFLADGVSWVESPVLSWVPNAEYNNEWEQYGPLDGVDIRIFSEPPQGMTRPQIARELLNLATSSQVVRDQSSRQRLQGLLDWNIESEPQRNFPLLRTAQPPRLEESALLQVDWSAVQIPADVRIALLSGLATVAQCASAMRPFMDLYTKGPKGKRQEKGDACNELSSLVEKNKGNEANKGNKDNNNIPQSCRKIKNIELNIRLSDKFMEGTWDQVGGTLEGPAGKAEFVFAKAPDAGTQKNITLEMKKYFKAEEIDIGGINKMTLNAQGILSESWTSLRNDEFTVQDISIHAECSDPSIEVNNNKFVGINKSYRHPGKESLWDFTGPYKQKVVGTLDISLGDWSFSPPCETIKDLTYDFKLANVFTGGTFDKIYLALGEGKQILLGSNVDAGYTKREKIALKETFGKDTLNIRDLKKLALRAELGSSWFSGDKWTFQGITFEATCAEVPKRMKLDKFESVNKEVQHQENKPAWTANISPKNWLELR